MIKTAVHRTIRRIKRIRLIHLLITLIALSRISVVGCLEKRSGDHPEDYGIYSNVASIISQQQQQGNQGEFKPSNWTAAADRQRKTKRLENYDRYRRYQEYNKYLRAKQSTDDSNESSYSNKNDFQFRRRSDLDDDYYSPAYYPSVNQHYGLVYPPPVQPSLISLPGPTVLATSSPAYYHHAYRKYRPAASRSYYHRIYPAASTLRRRLAPSPSASYETPTAALAYHATPSAYQSYYYGSGLAATHPQLPYASAAAGYPNTPALAHPTEHELHHHEGKEVHSLLPIITVIGIGAFMVSLN